MSTAVNLNQKIEEQNRELVKASTRQELFTAIIAFAEIARRATPTERDSCDGDTEVLLHRTMEITLEKLHHFIANNDDDDDNQNHFLSWLKTALLRLFDINEGVQNLGLYYPPSARKNFPFFDRSRSNNIRFSSEGLRAAEQLVDFLILAVFPRLNEIRAELNGNSSRSRASRRSTSSMVQECFNQVYNVIETLSYDFRRLDSSKDEIFGNVLATTGVARVVMCTMSEDSYVGEDGSTIHQRRDYSSMMSKGFTTVIGVLYGILNYTQGKLMFSTPEAMKIFCAVLNSGCETLAELQDAGDDEIIQADDFEEEQEQQQQQHEEDEENNNSNLKVSGIKYIAKMDMRRVILSLNNILSNSHTDDEITIRSRLALTQKELFKSLLAAVRAMLPKKADDDNHDEFYDSDEDDESRNANDFLMEVVKLLSSFFERAPSTTTTTTSTNSSDDEDETEDDDGIQQKLLNSRKCFIDVVVNHPNEDVFSHFIDLCISKSSRFAYSYRHLVMKMMFSIWSVVTDIEDDGNSSRRRIINDDLVLKLVDDTLKTMRDYRSGESVEADAAVWNKMETLLHDNPSIRKFFATEKIYERMGDIIVKLTSDQNCFNWFGSIIPVLHYISSTAKFYNNKNIKNNNCAAKILPFLLLPLAIATDTDISRFSSASQSIWQNFFDFAGAALNAVLTANNTNDDEDDSSSLSNVLEFLTSRSCPSALQQNDTGEEYYDTPDDKKYENITSIDVLIKSYHQASKLQAQRNFLECMAQICRIYEKHFASFTITSAATSPALSFGSPSMVDVINLNLRDDTAKKLSLREESKRRSNNDDFPKVSAKKHIASWREETNVAYLDSFSSIASAIASIVRVYPSTSTTIHQQTKSNSDQYYDDYEPLYFVSKPETLSLILPRLEIELEEGMENNSLKSGIEAVLAIAQFTRPAYSVLIQTAEKLVKRNNKNGKESSSQSTILVNSLVKILENEKLEGLHSLAQTTINEIVNKTEQECGCSRGQEESLKKEFLAPILHLKK